MRNEERIWSLVEAHRDRFVRLSDRIWDMPEIAYDEWRSVEEHARVLGETGFRVARDVAGIPTAVTGEAGSGGPVVAILGEYDALPGLSQEAGALEARPLSGDGMGHGCGHNLLGSAAALAATAVKDWLEETGTPGRVRYYGCPAEEGGAAKTFMVRDGAFADVAAALSWHPACFNAVDPGPSLANMRIDFTFHGRASHAAAAPELGRSALDAVELMNVGVNYLREHMPPGCRVHYAYLDAGGPAPNVVQARATVRQLVRAPELAGLHALAARVRRIAEGAALMTDTTVEARIVSGVSNVLVNGVLAGVMQAAFDRLGPPPFDAADRAFAAAMQGALTEEDIAAAWARMGREADGRPLCDFVLGPGEGRAVAEGSTDLGDVSWAVPFVEARVATCAIGTPFHTWQLTAQGKTPAAHKGMVHAAKVMAATAIELLARPGTLEKARAELDARLAKMPYVCPMPPEVMPPLRPRRV